MNSTAINEWLKLSERTRQNIFSETGKAIGLPEAAIEKDWWVMRTLELVFNTEVGPYTVFKGGTSLSKAWNLIDRFSEDIDLALDREFLGFNKEMTNSQVSKLRKKSFQYISTVFFIELKERFLQDGFDTVNFKLSDSKVNDQDPLIIEVYYKSLTETTTYIQPRVLVEIGSRSLREPFTSRSFCSLVGEHFKEKDFADKQIIIPTVNPERTFLEKIFLLHEEFQQPVEKIRVDRKSRHLYDLEKLMDSDFAKTALSDKELYQTIVEHRRALTPIRGIDYGNHSPEKINPIPPDEIIGEWEKDYKALQESMLYMPSLTFSKLIERMKTLKEKINKLKH